MADPAAEDLEPLCAAYAYFWDAKEGVGVVAEQNHKAQNTQALVFAIAASPTQAGSPT